MRAFLPIKFEQFYGEFMDLETPINTAFAIDIVEEPDTAYRKKQRRCEKYKNLKTIRNQRFTGKRMHSDDVEKIGRQKPDNRHQKSEGDLQRIASIFQNVIPDDCTQKA